MDERSLTIDEQLVAYLESVKQSKPSSYLKYSVGSVVLFEHNTKK